MGNSRSKQPNPRPTQGASISLSNTQSSHPSFGLTGAAGLSALGFQYIAKSTSLEESKSGTTDQGAATSPLDQPISLLHAKSKTIVTAKNWRTFIHDGTHYEEVARCAMEFCQETMKKDFDLVPYDNNFVDPLNLCSGTLLSRDIEKYEKVLVILPGKGKVRAGIFGRQLLMVHSLQTGSAIPFLQRASSKNFGIILLDPNVKIDKSTFVSTKLGYENVQQQWSAVVVNTFPKDKFPNLFILAHSQAGAQIVRCLNNERPEVVSQIKVLCQTDGTSSLHQVTSDSARELLTSPYRSLYCRSTPGSVCLHQAGQMHIPTASEKAYWLSRFGAIKVVWAGTRDHPYSNFTARDVIFDFMLSAQN